MSNEYKPKRAAAPTPTENKKTNTKKKPAKKSGKNGKNNKNKKKTTAIILSVILALLLLVFGVGFWFVNNKLNMIDYTEDETVDTNKEFVEGEDKVDFGEIDNATGSDYKSILKNWAINGGEKMSNKEIINILLIGSDASAEEAGRSHVTDKGNTDVMMLVSINKTEKKLKLISFMRDSYTYMDGFDRYAKLNAACANGGPKYLTETIENDYKIKIDGYALVDFDSFRQVIDILGGVTVDVPKYVGTSIKIPYGNGVTLNGEQALAFCRVRHTDANGDVSRVARQRQVINSLINKCKNASLSEINSMMDVILANVRTNVSKKDIVNYATQAVTNGWASFELTEHTMPTPDARYGYNGNSWIWVIDYPLAAQNLQKEIYGDTNIKLEENRKTAITVMGGRPEQKSN